MTTITIWVFGAILAAIIATVAWRARALSHSGAFAAFLTGTAAMLSGWSWGIILITYFVVSSALSRVGRERKRRSMSGRVSKLGARDAVQVFANGGVFAAAAIGNAISPDPRWQLVAIGALAASAADTWATEIGALSTQTPRAILGFRTVPVGTSGGVTILGFIAAAGGALLVAFAASIVGWPPATTRAALVGGIAGCLLDSILGGSIQARYWCPTCRMETERLVHDCGAATEHASGYRWLDNDGVNALATLSGAAVGLLTGAA